MSLWDAFTGVLGAFQRKPSFSISEPITATGYTRMRDVVALIDAVCDAYDNQGYTPLADGTTFCNRSVESVALALGCNTLGGKTADEIVAYISTAPDWSEVPMEKAQDLANAGSLLIAGLDSKALEQAHGHVVVVRPGKPCYSGKYGGSSPRCLNIGAENFLARGKRGSLTNQPCGLNEAFIPLPKIWAWRPSL